MVFVRDPSWSLYFSSMREVVQSNVPCFVFSHANVRLPVGLVTSERSHSSAPSAGRSFMRCKLDYVGGIVSRGGMPVTPDKYLLGIVAGTLRRTNISGTFANCRSFFPASPKMPAFCQQSERSGFLPNKTQRLRGSTICATPWLISTYKSYAATARFVTSWQAGAWYF